MAANPSYLLVLLLALFAHEVTALPLSYSGPQIADLNVLLPPRMTNPVHYRLLGSGGCFSWLFLPYLFSIYFSSFILYLFVDIRLYHVK